MPEDHDKATQDATVQVSGEELQALRQSAQLPALSRQDVPASVDPLTKESTLDMDLEEANQLRQASVEARPQSDDDSTKAIDRRNLVQIIKTEMRESSPGGQIKPFGILRHQERSTPLHSPQLPRPQAPSSDSHDDQDATQAINRDALRRLRDSEPLLTPATRPPISVAPDTEELRPLVASGSPAASAAPPSRDAPSPAPSLGIEAPPAQLTQAPAASAAPQTPQTPERAASARPTPQAPSHDLTHDASSPLMAPSPAPAPLTDRQQETRAAPPSQGPTQEQDQDQDQDEPGEASPGRAGLPLNLAMGVAIGLIVILTLVGLLLAFGLELL